MAICYAVFSGLCGTVSFLLSAFAGLPLSALMLHYVLAGIAGVLLLAWWRAGHVAVTQPISR